MDSFFLHKIMAKENLSRHFVPRVIVQDNNDEEEDDDGDDYYQL